MFPEIHVIHSDGGDSVRPFKVSLHSYQTTRRHMVECSFVIMVTWSRYWFLLGNKRIEISSYFLTNRFIV